MADVPLQYYDKKPNNGDELLFSIECIYGNWFWKGHGERATSCLCGPFPTAKHAYDHALGK